MRLLFLLFAALFGARYNKIEPRKYEPMKTPNPALWAEFESLTAPIKSRVRAE
jgi:hypothetical protein